MSETNENAPEEISASMKEETTDMANLMSDHVFKFISPLLTQICLDSLSAALTNPSFLLNLAMSDLTMGAFLYRRLLIESGVDVIALEQNFKDFNMD